MVGLLSIEEIDKTLDRENLKSYYLKSTAQPIVEHEQKDRGDIKPSKKIREIVQKILEVKAKNPDSTINVIVQIHGYNTGNGYERDYRKAQKELEKIQERDNSPDNLVIFLGYSWPSEKMSLWNLPFIFQSIKSLPGWLLFLDVVGIGWILIYIFSSWNANPSKWLMLGWATIVFPILAAILILLRATVYFRDSYRATHYGVPDLIQFFRAFEYLLIHKKDVKADDARHELLEENTIDRYDRLFKYNRIKLSFVGHSMGGFVATNLVRTLSDVFDSLEPGSTKADNLLPSRSKT